MRKENHLENLTPVSQLVTYTLLVLSVLVLVYLGVRLFSSVTKNRQEAEHLRSTITYVQNEVFLCEDQTAVHIADGPEGDMLILPVRDGKYEIRIYLADGYLREETATAGTQPDPGSAEKISEAGSFQLDLSDPTLLRIRIDGNEAVAHLGRVRQ